MTMNKTAALPVNPGDKLARQPADRRRAVTTADLEDRLRLLQQHVVLGLSRQDLVLMAQQMWGVQPRTGYWYLQQVNKRLVRNGQREDRTVMQQICQLQRGRLIEKLYMTMGEINTRDVKALPHLETLGSLLLRLIDARERTALEAEDRSPEDGAPPPRIQVTTRQNITQQVLLPPAGESIHCKTASSLPPASDEKPEERKSLSSNEIDHKLEGGETAPAIATIAPHCNPLQSLQWEEKAGR